MLLSVLYESGVLGSSLDEFYNNLKGRTAIFFDTETTGFKPKYPYRQITQLGAVALDMDSNVILSEFSEIVSLNPETLSHMEYEKTNPPQDKSIKTIEQVLGWTRYDPQRATMSPIDAGEKFVAWVAQYPNPLLVAQNAKFDMGFMNNLMKHNKIRHQVLDFLKFNRLYLEPILINLKRHGVIEAAEVLTKLFDPKRNKTSFSQQVLGKAFDVGTQAAHMAINDAKQLAELVKKVLDFVNRHKGSIGKDIVNDYGRARIAWRDRHNRR